MKIETIRDFRREVLSKDPARAAGETVLVRLATCLYLLRTSMGLTQEELADRSGLDQASISDIENGDANPTVRTLGRIASGLGVDAGALLEHTSLGVRSGSTVSLREGVKWQGSSAHSFTESMMESMMVRVIERKIAWVPFKGGRLRYGEAKV